MNNKTLSRFTYKATLFIFSALLLTSFLGKAQKATMDKAWNMFYENKISESRAYFIEATKDSSTKADANLALSILATVDKENKDAFNYFSAFYQASSNPIPATYALWSSAAGFDGSSKKRKEQIDLLNKLSKNTAVDGTIRALAFSLLGKYFESVNQEKDALNAYAQIGSIDEWQIAGVFENISESGFNKSYAPITTPQNDSTFINKNGAPVKWFNVPPNRKDKWIDFSYNFYLDDIIVYAQTFIYSPSEREAQLRIGTSGSLKAWVNGLLVMSESEERNNDLDTYITKVKLNKGYNRVLLQVGESGLNQLNFLTRITDENGEAMKDLTVSKTPQPYLVEKNYKPVSFPIPAEVYFLNAIKQKPADMINYILLANAYMRNGKFYEARTTLLLAQKLAPNCSYLYENLITVYDRENNETGENIAIEWLKDNDPKYPLAIRLSINDEVKKENYKGALAKVEEYEKLYGVDEYTTSKRIDIAAKTMNQKDVIKMCEDAYAKYPDYYDFVDLKHTIEVTVNNNIAAGINVWKKSLDYYYTNSTLTKIAADYFKKGDTDKALQIYIDIIKHSPYTIGYMQTLASQYYKQQDYKNAEIYYKKALEIAPYLGVYWRDLGRVYISQSRKREAIEAYNKALAYSPTDYQSRKELRDIENSQDVFDYFDNSNIYDLYKAAPDASAFPEDNSLYLTDETQKVVYSGGASEEKRIFAVKVFNEKGVDDWKQYSVYYTGRQGLNIEKAEVIKQNGSKIKAEIKDNKIVFTSLEPGDAIYVVYKIESYNTGKLAQHFWDSYYFNHFYPYQKSKYSLLISPDIKFKYKFSKDEIKPEEHSVIGFKMYVWQKENQASIKREDRMPNTSNIASVLFLSSIPDWTYVSNWYSDLASSKAKSDFEVKETVAALFKDKQNLGEEEKAKLIYSYIVKNIRYSSVSFLQSGLIPQKASKVLNTKIGDCKDVSTLFVAMCREVGLDAGLVLVDTYSDGDQSMLLPSIDFNHCIARVNINKKDYYIELTSDYLAFNTFYGDLINAFTLNISNQKEGKTVEPVLINPPTRGINIIERKTQLKITGNDIDVERISYRTGSPAGDMRRSYRDIGQKEQEKRLQKAVSGDFTNVELNSFEFKGLKGFADTVIAKYNYTASSAIKEVSGLSLFNLPWVGKASSSDFVFNKKREYAIDIKDFSVIDNESETISVTTPSKSVLAEIPKSVKLTCSIADYSLEFTVKGNNIVAKRTLKFKTEKVPSEQLKEFSDFYKKVIAADEKQIALKAGA